MNLIFMVFMPLPFLESSINGKGMEQDLRNCGKAIVTYAALK
jgi:hypothetical protein